jgi:hypothetical protein
MSKYVHTIAVVVQDASKDNIRKTLASWGDASHQEIRLRKLVELGWYFIDANGNRIGELVTAKGEKVLMKDGTPATPASLPISFLEASVGMRFDNKVSQIAASDWVNDFRPPTIEGATAEDAISAFDDLLTAVGPKHALECLNNGLRLGTKEKEIGKVKPKNPDTRDLEREFLATVTADLANPENLKLLQTYGLPTTNKSDFLTQWKSKQSQ